MTSELCNSSDVTIFNYHCVESIKRDTCAQFNDHQRNNSKVMMGALENKKVFGSEQGDVWMCLERLRSLTVPPLSNGSNLKLK